MPHLPRESSKASRGSPRKPSTEKRTCHKRRVLGEDIRTWQAKKVTKDVRNFAKDVWPMMRSPIFELFMEWIRIRQRWVRHPVIGVGLSVYYPLHPSQYSQMRRSFNSEILLTLLLFRLLEDRVLKTSSGQIYPGKLDE